MTPRLFILLFALALLIAAAVKAELVPSNWRDAGSPVSYTIRGYGWAKGVDHEVCFTAQLQTNSRTGKERIKESRPGRTIYLIPLVPGTVTARIPDSFWLPLPDTLVTATLNGLPFYCVTNPAGNVFFKEEIQVGNWQPVAISSDLLNWKSSFAIVPLLPEDFPLAIYTTKIERSWP